MNKRKSLAPALIFAIAFLIGFSIFNGYYYIENIYPFNIGNINKSNVSRIDNSNVWNTAYKYYTHTLGMDMSTYENIYNTYSLDSYMDKLLTPYYEQYGYDCVLVSGLKSPHKLANVYAYEKCCEIVGETKINKDALVKSLKKLVIDEKNRTGREEEKEFITYAKERLNLAISLLSGSVSSNMIAKHSASGAYCWVANGLNKNTRIRIYNKSAYLTARNHYIDRNSTIEFASKNTVKIISDIPYVLYIGDDVIMYDINARLTGELSRNERKNIFTKDLLFAGHTVSGKYSYTDQADYSDIPEYSFTFNAESGKIELN